MSRNDTLAKLHAAVPVVLPSMLLCDFRDLDRSAGLALNPGTPLSAIGPFLDACDIVLVMSVMPGFGGQKFERVALEKLAALRGRIRKDQLLEVDGGVNEKTIAECAQAGAHLVVVGSAIFRTRNYTQSVSQLHEKAQSGATQND